MQHIAGIETNIHLHDGNTSLCITSPNSALDGAAPRQRGNNECITRNLGGVLSMTCGNNSRKPRRSSDQHLML